MTTFKILSINTGSFAGTVKAENRDKAEQICLAKNIDVYDTYMLVDESADDLHYGSPYINDILEYLTLTLKLITMDKIATHTHVTINKTMIVDQTNIYFNNETKKAEKSKKTTYREIKGRQNQLSFLSSLEQCEGEFHGTQRTYNKFQKMFENNGIDVTYKNKRHPFNDSYMEVEFEYFN